jgi:hypothetical protein
MVGRRKLPLDSRARQPSIRQQLVEARHHLRLAHHRQLAELVELEALRIDPGQTRGVKRRALDGAGEQRSELLALVLHQPFGSPAEPAHVILQAPGKRAPETRAQHIRASVGDRAHVRTSFAMMR